MGRVECRLIGVVVRRIGHELARPCLEHVRIPHLDIRQLLAGTCDVRGAEPAARHILVDVDRIESETDSRRGDRPADEGPFTGKLGRVDDEPLGGLPGPVVIAAG